MQINPEALKALRTRSGWSVSKFATAVATSHAHISNIEAGRRQASPELIARIADVLDVPVMALISNRTPEEVA